MDESITKSFLESVPQTFPIELLDLIYQYTTIILHEKTRQEIAIDTENMGIDRQEDIVFPALYPEWLRTHYSMNVSLIEGHSKDYCLLLTDGTKIQFNNNDIIMSIQRRNCFLILKFTKSTTEIYVCDNERLFCYAKNDCIYMSIFDFNVSHNGIYEQKKNNGTNECIRYILPF